MNAQAYQLAQSAIADLKSAVYLALEASGDTGLTNAELGRSLGIYGGHVGHEGHISRTLLGLLENEGVIVQVPETKRWFLKKCK
ncbi:MULTISPECIES: hypothetical protein [Aeromonas]|jgi:hypothetical protein|uniref:hypothetical protein n=1 Tax=Aeromonas TaxID=642 RepID=UPI00232CF27B|nr:hypothetical protein [Aeromonas salmonicida]WCH26471.1 hypothetical protein ONZ66_18185 [Aeromonas salmonicida]